MGKAGINNTEQKIWNEIQVEYIKYCDAMASQHNGEKMISSIKKY